MIKLLPLITEKIKKGSGKKHDDVLDKFGEYLFGEWEGVEKDTQHEKKLFKALKDFLSGVSPNSFANAFKKLKEVEKFFPTELIPKGSKIYRGSVIKESEAPKLKWKKQGEYWVSKTTYSPKSKVQSWSSNLDASEDFIENMISADHDEIPVIYVSSANKKELLFNAIFLNAISTRYVGNDQFDEDEIIRMGGNISAVIMIHGDYFPDNLKESQMNMKLLPLLETKTADQAYKEWMDSDHFNEDNGQMSDKYPRYNLDAQESNKAAKFLMSKIDTSQLSSEEKGKLFNKLHAGVT